MTFSTFSKTGTSGYYAKRYNRSMTTSSEQEAFSLVIEHQKGGASENDIRYAFQRFMEVARVATAAEMSTEGPPGLGNPGRMDLYVHNTCIEFKTNILQAGQPHGGGAGRAIVPGQS